MGFLEEVKEKTKYANSAEGFMKLYGKQFDRIIQIIKSNIKEAAERGEEQYIHNFAYSESKLVSLVHDYFVDEGFSVKTEHVRKSIWSEYAAEITINWS